MNAINRLVDDASALHRRLYRGRDGHCRGAPAHIRTCESPVYGSTSVRWLPSEAADSVASNDAVAIFAANLEEKVPREAGQGIMVVELIHTLEGPRSRSIRWDEMDSGK
jgi:hypothetical protein